MHFLSKILEKIFFIFTFNRKFRYKGVHPEELRVFSRTIAQAFLKTDCRLFHGAMSFTLQLFHEE